MRNFLLLHSSEAVFRELKLIRCGWRLGKSWSQVEPPPGAGLNAA
jgi:hypothetical protein